MQRPVSAQQKAAIGLIGGLLGITVCAFAFLGGYATRMYTYKAPAASASVSDTSNPNGSGLAATGDFGALNEIYDALKAHYVDPSKLDDTRGLKQGAIDGLLNTVGDTHQVYVSPDDVQFEQSDLSGQFEGIGATVTQKNGEVSIEALIPDYPASKSNLKVGDVILSVDGQPAKGKSSTDIVRLIRGKAGTDVKIGVRHSDGKPEDISITRAQIKLQSVYTEELKDANGNPVPDLAYMRISQFQQTTDKEVQDYLKSIQGKPYKGLIIDLRNNPGGYLVQTENILNDFLKPGQTELIHQGRNDQESVDKAQSGSTTTSLPIVVLVNKQSASASEIVAGALRDNGRATIMGEQTFGKGTVNQFFPLKNDKGEVYVTVERWLTPKHEQIEGKGITPDVVVHLGDNDDPKSYFNQQLYQAIDQLHKGG